MKLIYIESENLHIDIDDLNGRKYTNEEVDDLIVLASSLAATYERRARQQDLIDDVEWFELYPSAKTAISRNLKNKINKIKDEIKNMSAHKNDLIDRFVTKIKDMDDMYKVREEIEKDCEEKLEYLKHKLSSLESSYNYVSKWDTKKPGKKGSRITQRGVEQAKSVAINNFLNINRAGNTKCIFHSEKTGSMHIYENNKFYCFGCGKHGSVIDIYMQLHQVDFKDAVLKLIGK